MVRASPLVLWLASPAEAHTCYGTHDAAQYACRNEAVVWLNTQSDIYHLQGERLNDNNEDGAFVCETGADANGDRPTKNGQLQCY